MGRQPTKLTSQIQAATTVYFQWGQRLWTSQWITVQTSWHNCFTKVRRWTKWQCCTWKRPRRISSNNQRKRSFKQFLLQGPESSWLLLNLAKLRRLANCLQFVKVISMNGSQQSIKSNVKKRKRELTAWISLDGSLVFSLIEILNLLKETSNMMKYSVTYQQLWRLNPCLAILTCFCQLTLLNSLFAKINRGTQIKALKMQFEIRKNWHSNQEWQFFAP